MSEIKLVNEVSKKPETENYKNIKPEKPLSDNEIKDKIKEEFKDKEKEKDLDIVGEEYLQDLMDKSEYPETIPNDKIDFSKLEKLSTEERAIKKEEFTRNKEKLIKEWEDINNKEWPRYEHDVVNSRGIVIRRAGDRYDAHHIIPLKLGGENISSNITPLHKNMHNEIHSKDGSCTKLMNRYKEA